MSKKHVDDTVQALEEGAVPAWISAHVRAYQDSGGREGHWWDTTAVGGDGPRQCLLLTTVGRRTGHIYTHPLLYGMDGDDYVVVASKGGADTQPNWYFNLRAAQRVTLQVGAEIFSVRPTLAAGAERSRLWALMTGIYPPYLDYQAKTSREIPLFVLSRFDE